MDLVPHGFVVLEIEGGERADFDTAVALEGRYRAPPLLTDSRVFLARQDVGPRQLARGGAHALDADPIGSGEQLDGMVGAPGDR